MMRGGAHGALAGPSTGPLTAAAAHLAADGGRHARDADEGCVCAAHVRILRQHLLQLGPQHLGSHPRGGMLLSAYAVHACVGVSGQRTVCAPPQVAPPVQPAPMVSGPIRLCAGPRWNGL